MSGLTDFLQVEKVSEMTGEVTLPRLADTIGTFKFKILQERDWNNARSRATTFKNKEAKVDGTKLTMGVIISQVYEPNFRDSEGLKSLDLKTPEDVLNTYLLPGEIEELFRVITEASGFNKDTEELDEEAKN